MFKTPQNQENSAFNETLSQPGSPDTPSQHGTCPIANLPNCSQIISRNGSIKYDTDVSFNQLLKLTRCVDDVATPRRCLNSAFGSQAKHAILDAVLDPDVSLQWNSAMETPKGMTSPDCLFNSKSQSSLLLSTGSKEKIDSEHPPFESQAVSRVLFTGSSQEAKQNNVDVSTNVELTSTLKSNPEQTNWEAVNMDKDRTSSCNESMLSPTISSRPLQSFSHSAKTSGIGTSLSYFTDGSSFNGELENIQTECDFQDDLNHILHSSPSIVIATTTTTTKHDIKDINKPSPIILAQSTPKINRIDIDPFELKTKQKWELNLNDDFEDLDLADFNDSGAFNESCEMPLSPVVCCNASKRNKGPVFNSAPNHPTIVSHQQNANAESITRQVQPQDCPSANEIVNTIINDVINTVMTIKANDDNHKLNLKFLFKLNHLETSKRRFSYPVDTTAVEREPKRFSKKIQTNINEPSKSNMKCNVTEITLEKALETFDSYSQTDDVILDCNSQIVCEAIKQKHMPTSSVSSSSPHNCINQQQSMSSSSSSSLEHSSLTLNDSLLKLTDARNEVIANCIEDINVSEKFDGFETSSADVITAETQKFEEDMVTTKTGSTKFDGFKTAGGDTITVSADAIAAAKRKFEEDIVTTKTGSTKFDGFKTAGGDTITVSADAIAAAKRKFEEDIVTTKTGSTKFDGFKTAGGDIITVSVDAIAAAKRKFEEDIVTTKTGSTKFDGFKTAGGDTITVSADAIAAAKRKFEEDIVTTKTGSTKFDGFKTAGGDIITVSVDAIAAVKRKFEEDIFTTKTGSTKFDGFKTAGGDIITVSADAIAAAKQKIEEDIVTTKTGSTKFDGFKTAGGDTITVSANAIAAAKRKFEEDIVTTKTGSTKFDGFKTAGGDTITVSADAIAAAKRKFEEDIVTTKTGSTKFNGFKTASGDTITVSADAIAAAKRKFEEDIVTTKTGSTKFDGFKTAGGDTITVSADAIAAAKRKFEEDIVTTKTGSTKFDGFKTAGGDIITVSADAIAAETQKFEEDLVTTKTGSTMFDGFKTAGGDTITVSADAIAAAKRKFEEDIVTTKTGSTKFDGFKTAGGDTVTVSVDAIAAAKRKFEEDIVTTKTGSTKFDGFKTAGGDTITVSADAIAAAKRKFEEDIVTTKTGSTKFDGFKTAGGDTITVSADAIAAAKRKFEEDIVTTKTGSTKFDGFKTAGGDTITVSADAIAAAKRKFEEDIVTTKTCSTKFDGFKIASGGNLNMSVDAMTHARINLKDVENCNPVNVDDSIVSIIQRASAVIPNISIKDNYSEINKEKDATETNANNYEAIIRDRMAVLTNISSEAVKEISLKPIHSTKMTKQPAIPPLQISTPIGCRDRFSNGYSTLSSRSSVAVSATTPVLTRSSNQKRKRLFHSPLLLKTRQPCGSDSSPLSKKQLLHDDMNINKRPKIEHQKLIKQASQHHGILYKQKTERRQRVTLQSAVNGQSPNRLTIEELYGYGVSSEVINLTLETALALRLPLFGFDANDDENDQHVATDNGAEIKCGKDSNAGIAELTETLYNMNGVDPCLIPDGWIENHYKLIVWKLAGLERSFPNKFGSRSLTINGIMQQLRYRYDLEIHCAKRPAIRKIIERDDIASKRLVLCVTSLSSNLSTTDNQKESPKSNKNAQASVMIDVTDGWYTMPALLDSALTKLLLQGKIFVGLKLCTSNAELCGPDVADHPLQAKGNYLHLHCNSTRRAKWYSKLGFQKDQRPFPVQLSTLHPDGGLISCVDVTILRVYPMQWMEKDSSSGMCVFRNQSMEDTAKREYEIQYNIKADALMAKIQSEEENTNKGVSTRSKRARRSLDSATIRGITSGTELLKMIDNAMDPSSIQELLSETQKEAVSHCIAKQKEDSIYTIRRKFENEWAKLQEQCPSRSVTELQRMRICNNVEKSNLLTSDAMLTLWRPKQEMMENLVEGATVRLYNVAASATRYNSTSLSYQLSTTKSTRFEVLSRVSALPKDSCRKVIGFHEIRKGGTPTLAFNEIDAVGVIVNVTNFRSRSDCIVVQLCDDNRCFLSVQFWGKMKPVINHSKMTVGDIVSFSNLTLKRHHENNIPVAVYSDLSAMSSNPRVAHLSSAVEKLKRKCLNSPENLEKLKTELTEHTIESPQSAALNRSLALKTPKLQNDFNTSSISIADDLDLTIERQSQLQRNQVKRKSLQNYGEPPPIKMLDLKSTPTIHKRFQSPTSYNLNNTVDHTSIK